MKNYKMRYSVVVGSNLKKKEVYVGKIATS